MLHVMKLIGSKTVIQTYRTSFLVGTILPDIVWVKLVVVRFLLILLVSLGAHKTSFEFKHHSRL